MYCGSTKQTICRLAAIASTLLMRKNNSEDLMLRRSYICWHNRQFNASLRHNNFVNSIIVRECCASNALLIVVMKCCLLALGYVWWNIYRATFAYSNILILDISFSLNFSLWVPGSHSSSSMHAYLIVSMVFIRHASRYHYKDGPVSAQATSILQSYEWLGCSSNTNASWLAGFLCLPIGICTQHSLWLGLTHTNSTVSLLSHLEISWLHNVFSFFFALLFFLASQRIIIFRYA